MRWGENSLKRVFPPNPPFRDFFAFSSCYFLIKIVPLMYGIYSHKQTPQVFLAVFALLFEEKFN
jgi:hypothetical protein